MTESVVLHCPGRDGEACGSILAVSPQPGIWELRHKGRRIEFAGALLKAVCEDCGAAVFPEVRARRPRSFSKPRRDGVH